MLKLCVKTSKIGRKIVRTSVLCKNNHSQVLATWCKTNGKFYTVIFTEFVDRQFICWHKCLDTYCINIKYVQMAALSENVLCNVMCCNIRDIIIVIRHIGESTWCRCVRGWYLFNGWTNLKEIKVYWCNSIDCEYCSKLRPQSFLQYQHVAWTAIAAVHK